MKKLLFSINPRRWFLQSKQEVRDKAVHLLPPSYDPVGLHSTIALEKDLESITLHSSEEIKRASFIISENIAEKLDEKIGDARLATFGAVEVGAYTLSDVYSKLANVDEKFISSIERLSGEKLGNLADLKSKLDNYGGGQLTDALINKLKGHLGEEYVAKHLQDAGVSVEWPSASNQAGWDLSINGSVINVKTLKDSQELYNHFQNYPDIPAIVPADMANIPDDAIHFTYEDTSDLIAALEQNTSSLVIVDDSLSHIEVSAHVEQTSASLDDIMSGHGAVEAKIPVITLALSSFREARLLLNEQTDLISASKNIALDVTGTGVGGIAGGKAGAVIGSMILPGVGTAIGGVLGAIGGAMFGRLVTNDVKQEPYIKALNSYKVIADQLQKKLIKEEKNLKALTRIETDKQQRLLDELLVLENQKIQMKKADVEKCRNGMLSLSQFEITNLIEMALIEIFALEEIVIKKWKHRTIWQKYFWPSEESVSEELALQVCREVKTWLYRCKVEHSGTDLVPIGKMFPELGRWGLVKLPVAYFFKEKREILDKGYAQLISQINLSAQQMEGARSAALISLNSFVLDVAKKSEERLKPSVQKLENSKNSLEVEAGKLGIDLKNPKSA